MAEDINAIQFSILIIEKILQYSVMLMNDLLEKWKQITWITAEKMQRKRRVSTLGSI